MAERLGEAILELSTRDRGLKRGVADAERQARQLDKSFARVGKNLQSLGSSMQQAGATMTRSISLPLALIAGASVKAFAGFDAAMTQSTAIMGDVSTALREEMVDAARQMARETTFSAKQAAESYFFLASAGLDAEASIAALPQVAKFAQAGMFDMATATDLLTDAQSALGLTLRDDVVGNMENMARISDVLVRANTLANATVEQFSQALTREAGAALKSFNIDVEEGVAVLAAFADQGVKGEIAGTGLSRILRLMTTAAVDNADAYERLNVRVFDTFGNIRNLGDIIEDLEGALGGLTDAQRVAELSALGFQARVQGVILPLLGTSDAIRTYERELRSAAGFTESVAGKQLQTFAEQMKLVKDELVDVGIELGGTLAPIILDFARNKLIPAIEGTRGLVEAFGDLSPQAQKAITGVSGFAIILGPLLIAMGSLVRLIGFAAVGFATLTTRLAALRVAAAGAAGPLGLLAATLLALNEAISIFTAKAQAAEQAAIGQTNVLGQMNRAARDAQLAINQFGTLNVKQAEAVRQAWLAGMQQFQGFGREILRIQEEIDEGVGRDREIVLTARLEELRKKADLTRAQIERLQKVISAAPEAFAKAGVSAEDFAEALGGGDGGGGGGVAPAAEAVADEIQNIIDQATPLETAFASLTGQANKLNQAIGEGSVRDLERAQRAYENLQKQIGRLLVEMGDVIVKGPKVIEAITPPPEVHLNWDRIAASLPKATAEMEDVARTVPDISDSLALVADNAARVFEAIGEERWAETARAISGVISAVIALSDAFSTLSQTGGGGGQGGGQGQQGQQGAQLAAALSFVNAWFAVIAAAFVLFEAFARKSRDFTEQFEITSKGLRDASESLSFSQGFEFGAPGEGGRVDFSGVKAEFQRFIDSFNQTLQEVMSTIGLSIDDSLAAFEFSLKTKVDKKTGQITDVYVRLADETGKIISNHFETIAQAEQFILQRFLQQAVEAGAQIDQAVQEVITGFFGDPEKFQEAVTRVQSLADQAALALGEVGSALQLEMQRLPAQLQALRIELTNLGLSVAQVERLVGGQLVASMQAWRQQITGEELSIATRQAIQKANAQLFNAERQLRIADLNARRAELEAQLGLTRAELELIRQGTIGYAEALKAKGAVYNAEIKLIIDQIKAINKIIEALVQIPEINIGRLRLPGVPRVGVPSAPRVPTGGGGGAAGPSLAEQLASLLDRLFPEQARAREFREQMQILSRALAEGLVTAQRYQQAVRALREEMTRGIRDALASLREFRVGLQLTATSPLSFGRQLLVAQREFVRQQRVARQTGDVSGFRNAAQALLDLARQGFGSTAGFQGIFRDILRATDDLESDLGAQLDELLKPPAEQTSMNTKEIAETSERIRENTERTRMAVERVEQETGLMNERNQIGHGKTQIEIRDESKKMDKRVEEQTRAFIKAIERIRVA